MESVNYLKKLSTAHLPAYEEFPTIELYLDQVLKIINDVTAPFVFTDSDKLLTGTMVNNYVKHGVLPAPHKKLYNREHLTKLVFITILKPIFSIPEIAQFMEQGDRAAAPRVPYNHFKKCLETCVDQIFFKKAISLPEDEMNPLYTIVLAAVSKLYIQYSLAEAKKLPAH